MNDFSSSEFSAEFETLLMERGSGESWFDFGRSPEATERVGKSMAESTRSYLPDVIASWSGAAEAVLAHIVARELRAVRTAIEVDLGLLSMETEIPASSRILLVSTFWTRQRSLASLRTLLEGQGHTVVAARSLLPSASEQGTSIPFG